MGSYTQKHVPQLRVSHMKDSNCLLKDLDLKDLKDLYPMLMFRKLEGPIKRINVDSYLDASFNSVTGR